MARITVEDCLSMVNNRFAVIHLAAKRVRQLRKGSEPLVLCKNKDIVTALREIAAGKVIEGKTIDPNLLIESSEESGSEELFEFTSESSPEEQDLEEETSTEEK